MCAARTTSSDIQPNKTVSSVLPFCARTWEEMENLDLKVSTRQEQMRQDPSATGRALWPSFLQGNVLKHAAFCMGRRTCWSYFLGEYSVPRSFEDRMVLHVFEAGRNSNRNQPEFSQGCLSFAPMFRLKKKRLSKSSA